VGDATYSRCRHLPVELSGQALHAVQLGLDHPISGERLVLEAPLPERFVTLLRVLRGSLPPAPAAAGRPPPGCG
jgi:23S rRNA pseudouridine1911/1915/1917 synthase